MRDASDHPDDDLVREVYAHFGLAMYLAQVFETGLITILTVLETATSAEPSVQQFDAVYVEHERLTFGNLMAALSAHNFLPGDLMVEASRLKRERDRLANTYFRGRSLDFVTYGGCRTMIEELKALEKRFGLLDERVADFQRRAFSKYGYTREAADQMVNKLRNEARAIYSAHPKNLT